MIAIGFLAEAKILVTGSNGFVGGSLLRSLENSGALVFSADIGENTASAFKHFQIELTDQLAVENMLNIVRPDIVFHLAGKVGTYDPPDNFAISQVLLSCLADKFDNCKVVTVGSAAEYGEPVGPNHAIVETDECRPISQYGRDKLRVTEFCLELAKSGMNVSVARPFNIIGPGIPSGLVLGQFIAKLKKKSKKSESSVISMGPLSAIRDFISVSDTAQALELLAGDEKSGEIYNICSNRPMSVRHLLEEFAQSIHSEIEIIESGVFQGIEEVFGCHKKLTKATGWKPSPLKDCFAQILQAEAIEWNR